MVAAKTIKKDSLIKLLYIGHSGTGKTGSLISLLRAGKKIRLLDMDNGFAPLIALAERENPDLLDNLDIISHRDKFKADIASGTTLDGTPKAYVNAIKSLTTWDDGTKPGEWGPDYVLVIDSLTALSRAAFHWAKGFNPSAKDGRQWYAAAGESLKTLIEMLTSSEFRTNLIMISHIDLRESPEGLTKGYVSSLGQALGPHIPKYFNNLVMAESSGSGENVRRMIKTMPTSLIDLKVSRPWDIDKSLPLDSGLATIFSKLASPSPV